MPPKKAVNRRLSLATPNKSLITNFFTPGRKFAPGTSQTLLRKVFEKPKIPLLSPKKEETIEISDDDEKETLPNSQQENLFQLVPKKLEFHETPRKKFPSILNSPKGQRIKEDIRKKSPGSIKKEVPKKPRRKTLPKIPPEYKIIQDTKFAVDAFRFGSIKGVSHYFLTHYHADHYIGLTKKFAHPIYCGNVTGALVRKFISNSLDIRTVDIGNPVIVEGVEITAIDANHCPGALMFVFKLQSGKCILHTGDFRAYPDMESEPFFWNNSIDTIYLDTTYLKAQYSFKPQTEAIADVIRYVEEAQLKNVGARMLFVCAAYFIGKERVWTRIAEYFDYKVWVDDRRRSALELLGSEEYTKYLEPDPTRANVHVKSSMNYQGLAEYSEQFVGVFDVIVYFDPSGWNFGKTRKYKFASKINIVSVEYSEHSSCSELERFVKFIRPKEVISTVPVGRDLHKTCEIPKSWLEGGVKPMCRNFQLSISNFLNGKNKKSIADPEDLDACLSSD